MSGTTQQGSGERSPQPDSPGFLNHQTLAFLAFILAPVLGLVTAVMGLIFVLQGHTVIGVVFLVLITQVFVALGLWANARRRSLGSGR